MRNGSDSRWIYSQSWFYSAASHFKESVIHPSGSFANDAAEPEQWSGIELCSSGSSAWHVRHSRGSVTYEDRKHHMIKSRMAPCSHAQCCLSGQITFSHQPTFIRFSVDCNFSFLSSVDRIQAQCPAAAGLVSLAQVVVLSVMLYNVDLNMEVKICVIKNDLMKRSYDASSQWPPEPHTVLHFKLECSSQYSLPAPQTTMAKSHQSQLLIISLLI